MSLDTMSGSYAGCRWYLRTPRTYWVFSGSRMSWTPRMTVALLAVAAERRRGRTGWVLPMFLPFCRQVQRAAQHSRDGNLLQNYSSEGADKFREEEGAKVPM